MPDKGGGFILSPCLRVPTVVVGKVWEQDGKQLLELCQSQERRDECCSSARSFSLACSRTPAEGMVLPTSGWIFSFQPNLSGNSLTACPGVCLPGDSNLLKLAETIKHDSPANSGLPSCYPWNSFSPIFLKTGSLATVCHLYAPLRSHLS